MSIEFYDVKKKAKVQVPESAVKKVKFERPKKDGGISVRYGFKAEFEGSKMTKFVSQSDWEALDAPEA